MEELPPVRLADLKNRIITDEIMEYDNISTLNSLLIKLKNSSNESLNQFQEVILPLVDELLRLSEDYMLSFYKKDIIEFIKNKPKVIVDVLILRCYEDKDGILRGKIVSGEDSFFLENNFDDMTDGNSKLIKVIFKFKDFWGKLNQENKDILKSYLLSIVALCDIRYLNYKKFLCLKKLNSKYSSLLNQFENSF